MGILKNKLKFIIMLIINFNISYSFIGDYKNFEDAYVEISARKKTDDFFLVKYDYENEKVYLGVKSLFYFLEIYTIDVNLSTREIFGSVANKNLRVKFSDENSFIEGDDIFIGIEDLEKLKMKDSKYFPSQLRITMDPLFELPIEEREESKLKRIRLDQSKGEDGVEIDYLSKGKIFTPGLLKLNYYQRNIKESDNIFDLEYANQLLYGDFYMRQKVNPEKELDLYRLTYHNVFKKKILVLGDFNIDLPGFVDVSNNVKGLYIGEDNTYITKQDKEGYVKIIGKAKDVDIIELYQGQVLIEYLKPNKEDFEFKIKDRGSRGEYNLKIYYNNGKIENRKIYLAGDRRILNEGKVDYTAQFGISKEKKYSQKYGNVRYGLKDWITLGLGVYDLKSSSEGKEYQLLKNNVIFKSGIGKNKTVTSFTNYYDDITKSNSYSLEIIQNLGDINLNFQKEKYGKKLKRRDRLSDYYRLSVNKNYKNNLIEAGYSSKKNDFYGKEDEYFLSLENRSFYQTAFGIEIKRKRTSQGDFTIYSPEVSYYGVKNLNFILRADIESRDKTGEIFSNYRLKAYSKKLRLAKSDLYYDIGLSANYSSGKDFLVSLEFNMYYEKYFNIETPMYLDSNGYNISLKAEKVIDLSNIKRVVKNTGLDKAWIFGKVFLDSNGNEKYDVGEKLLKNIGIKLNGETVLSNNKGKYFIDGVMPNTILELSLNGKTIDPMLKSNREKIIIVAKASEGIKIDLPVSPVSMVSGNIWMGDKINDRKFMRIISMTNISLERNGKVYKEIDPEYDGLFFFKDVIPGEYIIKFNYLGDEKIKFVQPEIPVNVKIETDEEGGYFEGFDTIVEIDDSPTEKSNEISEQNKEETDNIVNILNNF